MIWAGLGIGFAWQIRARVTELHLLRAARERPREPDQELPDAELSDVERRAAVDREVARRLSGAGR